MGLHLADFYDHNFWLMTFRIIMAAILSGLIGFEREINNHSAGFRTHILVGVGSSLMMLLSLYGFEPYLNASDNIRFDPARIPSYVISGIGFLGAGTIMVHGMTIRGLTTAASIWTVAGIGLIVGVGMYGPAILTTFVVLLSLVLLNRIEKSYRRKKNNRYYRLVISQNVRIGEILELFDQNMVLVRKIEVENESREKRNVIIEIEPEQKVDRSKIIDELSRIEEVICDIQS